MDFRSIYWRFALCGLWAGVKSFVDDSGEKKFLFSVDYLGGKLNSMISEDDFDSLSGIAVGSEVRIQGKIDHRLDGPRLRVDNTEVSGVTENFKPLTESEFSRGPVFVGSGIVVNHSERQSKEGKTYNQSQVSVLGGTIELSNLPDQMFKSLVDNVPFTFSGRIENVLSANWEDKKRTLQNKLRLVFEQIVPTSDNVQKNRKN